MLAFQLLSVLILLAVCSFIPGFFFVRRLRWNPLEKVCGSVGLSLILVYLFTWAVYVLAPGLQPGAYFAVPAICAAMAVAARRDLRALAGIAQVRRAAAGFGFLTVWTLLVLAMIRVSSGAGWAGDWLEHFQRCLFFLRRFPVHTVISSRYALPARPPLMNVLGAFYLGQAGERFEIFQLVFLFLNLLPFLAGCLLLPALGGKRRRPGKWAMLWLAGIFAMNPLVMENATYGWTKSLPAFFVMLAISLYLAALRKGDSGRRIAAFLALSAGLLAHYSAGPYLVILTAHYLFTAFRRRAVNYREAGAIAALCGLLLFTWFGWSVAVYGTRVTVASNTAVTDARKVQGSAVEKIAGNLYDSVVPRILRDSAGALHAFDQPSAAGYVRDNTFILYQTSLVFGMGALGGPVVVWLLLGWVRRKEGAGAERGFWLWLIPAAVVLGIAVVGERDVNGLAHLTLIPLETIGLAWLAANCRWRRWAAWLVLAGALVDFPMGVMLQARVENLENGPGDTAFAGLRLVRGGFAMEAPPPDAPSRSAWQNWFSKHEHALPGQWRGELDRHPGDDTRPARAFLDQLDRDDQNAWQGWFGRHGGTLTYLGDAFGEGWAPGGLLAALWLALLWMLWRYLPPAPAPVKAPGQARRKGARRRR